MRIRPPELETSICDVKYHVSLKGPYCTLTMTNWFLQALSVIPRGSWGDVARRFTMIRWKGPYCTLTTTNWFLQALSVIPRGSWDDVARRFTMIRWQFGRPPPLPHIAAALRRPVPPPCAATYVIGLVSITAMRSFHPCQNPSDLLVQIDGGIKHPVVDLIDDLPPPTV
ncbi:Serine/threonine protein kinase domain containing protein [Dorcoceras hygrometricum]|uniref:Serine/threonine protein kinase domain containing protein n=1 Tax=Dorcoceras hygrometricum TaxID=472368 RepID=A0A2Z7AML8_9LAMI|nr:Serine/threonine protein kinase domain containing protein [Dorcoceras hygrometricum]